MLEKSPAATAAAVSFERGSRTSLGVTICVAINPPIVCG
jgi:hypothetical protein